jgi:hypothetical protein
MTARPGHAIADGEPLYLLQPLIDAKEKSFVFPDWPADSPAEVVTVKCRDSAGVEEVPRI